MPGKPLNFDTVCELAGTFPNIEVRTGSRGPSLKYHGRMLACQAIHKSAEPGSLVVKVGFDQRDMLILSDPEVFYLTEHYVNYPSVLVRLSRVRHSALRDLIKIACEYAHKKKSGRKCRRQH